jgi:hypothetical protein
MTLHQSVVLSPLERGQQMGEMVENVQEMGDGIQVHPSFHTDVKELEYKDLMMRTFTQPDHQRVTEDSVFG